MKKAIIIGLATTLTLTAQTAIRPYVSGSASYANMPDSEIRAAGGAKYDISYNSGYAIEGAIGIRKDLGLDTATVRTEIALSFQHNQVDRIIDPRGVLGPAGAKYSETVDFDLVATMLNGYLEIPVPFHLVPYLMIGGGAAHANLNGQDDMVAIGQVGSGLSLALNETVTLDLNYRFVRTGIAELADDQETDYSTHRYGAGIRIQF